MSTQTPKTAAEWFDMLIEPYCTQAKQNSLNFPLQQDKNRVYKSLYDALFFDFNFTPLHDGEEWRKILVSVNNGETTYLKPTESQFGTWISVEDVLPKSQRDVLVYGVNEYGKERKLRCRYVNEFEISTSDQDFEGDTDYHEEKDEYFWPKGWYETNEYSEMSWRIDWISHWMPLPPNPTT